MYKKIDKQIMVCSYSGKLFNNKNNNMMIYTPICVNLKNIKWSDKKV